MPRKLKTYQASIGFYDLAVAAPSMKAALEAWGADSNLFHQGVAAEVDDPAVVAVTLEKPGVVLKRPIGSTGVFSEHSELPDLLGGQTGRAPKRPGRNPKRTPKIDDLTQRKAAVQFEKQHRRRDAERLREEAAQARRNEQRQRALAKANAAIQDAERQHNERHHALVTERNAVESRLKAEEERWEAQRRKLDAARRRIRE
jgi:colicin import membrane protein